MEMEGPMKKDLPNARRIELLGILALVLFLTYSLLGLVLGIVVWVMANEKRKLFMDAPEDYTVASLRRVNVGRLCGVKKCSGAIFWPAGRKGVKRRGPAPGSQPVRRPPRGKKRRKKSSY